MQAFAEGRSEMNTTIIIPAYNPEEELEKVVDRIWDFGNQVILVDDGSDQAKQELFERLSERAIVIHHTKNLGKGAAIKTALRYIKENLWDCDVIGVMDADGQHLPEDMEKLVMRAGGTEHALFLGVRDVGKSMPLRSRIGNAVTRAVFRLRSGVRVSDTQTGLRAFRRDLLEPFLSREGTRYEYETNVLLYCAKKKIPIIEVPIKTIYHDRKNSCSHFHVIQDSIRIYRELFRQKETAFPDNKAKRGIA